jgi:hypothetical protein
MLDLYFMMEAWKNTTLLITDYIEFNLNKPTPHARKIPVRRTFFQHADVFLGRGARPGHTIPRHFYPITNFHIRG